MSKRHDIFELSAEMPERKLIGRIMRAERIGPPPYGRTSFEIDAIDMSVPLEGVADALAYDADPQPFAAIRIVTTQRRMNGILGFDPAEDIDAMEGHWVQLEIGPKAQSMPIAYHAQLGEQGYSRLGRGRLVAARFLFGDAEIDRVPRPLSAQVAPSLTLAHKIARESKFPPDAIRDGLSIRRLLRGRDRPETIIVRDVGQANFVTAVDKRGRQLFHFDAGWPIAFNGKTAPKSLPRLTGNVPVILSHWDFDHLLGFYRFPELKLSHWIVPVQNYGPGAQRVANWLHKEARLHGYSGGRLHCGSIDIFWCQGTHLMNDTGLAVTVTLTSGLRVAMLGDATYDCAKLDKPVHCLLITHHGADFNGPVVQAAGPKSPAVVSAGRGNVYRHPRPDALRRHRLASWSISFTMSQPGRSRGDRRL